MVKAKMSIQFIAKELGKHPTSIRREIKRNAQKRGNYSAKWAVILSNERKERYNRHRKFTAEVEKTIRHYLENEQWSPKQIVGYCQKENIPMVSHERIYQYVRQNRKEGGTLVLVALTLPDFELLAELLQDISPMAIAKINNNFSFFN